MSKQLKSVLLDRIAELNEQIAPLQQQVDAAWVIVHAIAAEAGEANSEETADAPPKKKRGRRTNAQIAADKAAAEAAERGETIAVITDEDEEKAAAQ